MSLSRLLAVASADLRSRLRRPATLVFLGLLLAAASTTFPDPRSGQGILSIGGRRAVYTSAALAVATAGLLPFLLGLFGFYAVSNAIALDRRSGVGPLLGATPVTNGEYLLGKLLGNLSLLSVVTLAFSVVVMAVQVVHGEAPLEPARLPLAPPRRRAPRAPGRRVVRPPFRVRPVPLGALRRRGVLLRLGRHALDAGLSRRPGQGPLPRVRRRARLERARFPDHRDPAGHRVGFDVDRLGGGNAAGGSARRLPGFRLLARDAGEEGSRLPAAARPPAGRAPRLRPLRPGPPPRLGLDEGVAPRAAVGALPSGLRTAPRGRRSRGTCGDEAGPPLRRPHRPPRDAPAPSAPRRRHSLGRARRPSRPSRHGGLAPLRRVRPPGSPPGRRRDPRGAARVSGVSSPRRPAQEGASPP